MVSSVSLRRPWHVEWHLLTCVARVAEHGTIGHLRRGPLTLADRVVRLLERTFFAATGLLPRWLVQTPYRSILLNHTQSKDGRHWPAIPFAYSPIVAPPYAEQPPRSDTAWAYPNSKSCSVDREVFGDFRNGTAQIRTGDPRRIDANESMTDVA